MGFISFTPFFLNCAFIWQFSQTKLDPDRAPLKEVLGGQYNYTENGEGKNCRRMSGNCQCSKDPCAQKVSGGRTGPSAGGRCMDRALINR